MTASAGTTGKPFVVTRHLAAPRELVFDVFTQEAHLMQWMGPRECPLSRCSVDLRPGGSFHYAMRLPDGREMWGKWIFREIVRPSRLVVVVHFSDAEGGVTRHPMAPSWPLTTLSTTTFEEENGGTRLRLEWRALDASEAEMQTFDAGHASMNQGWSETFAQLEAYLGTLHPSRG